MTDTTYTHSQDKVTDGVTTSNGYWFYFKLGEHNIAVFGSAVSGRETVFVDDEVVSNSSNMFSFSGEHSFVLDGKSVKVVLKVEHYLSGRLSCKLYEQGKLLDTQEKGYKISWTVKDFAFKFFVYFFAGFGFATFTVKLFRLLMG